MPVLIEALQQPGAHARESSPAGSQHGAARPLGGAPPDRDSRQSRSRLAADAATALGNIGDPRAVPFLTYPRVRRPVRSPAVREAAQAAIGRLTGRPFSRSLASPVRVLTDAALELPPPCGRVSECSRCRLDLGQDQQGARSAPR